MTHDGLQRAWADARTACAPDVGWEPAYGDAVLRRRRRAQWSQAGVLIVVTVVVGPLVRTVMDRSPHVSWLWPGLALVVVAMAGWSHVTARGRAAWQEQARQEILVEHALRHHVSIGSADRALVTERARKIERWAWASLVGWPLLVAVFATILVASADGTAARIGFGFIGVVVCAGLARAERRRLRWARRWLADPLAGDEATPWT